MDWFIVSVDAWSAYSERARTSREYLWFTSYMLVFLFFLLQEIDLDVILRQLLIVYISKPGKPAGVQLFFITFGSH